MGYSFETSGISELKAALDRAGQRAVPMMRMAIRKTAADITTDAKVYAPVRTGNLRSSIGFDYQDTSDGGEAVVGPTASYGGHLEFGTSRMAPRPFIGPAFQRRTPSLEQALGVIADRTLE